MTTDSHDTRRRRAKFRANHRGMKEIDIILGGFADVHGDTLSHDELDRFELLLEVLDRDLFKWFMGEAPVPGDFDTGLFARICDHHGIVPVRA